MYTLYIYIYRVCVHICIYNEGCLKGIPPSTYLRIINVLLRHTLSSKKKYYSKNSLRYMEIWNNFHQNDTVIAYF